MNQFTAHAPTVEAAIEVALRELGITREEGTIEIIDEGKKGFLGFGSKPATVKVTAKEKAPKPEETIKPEVEEKEVLEEAVVEVATQENAAPVTPVVKDDAQAIKEVALYFTNVSKELGAPALVRIERSEEKIIFHLDTEKGGLLIGKHGKTINALQYLGQVILHRHAASKLTAVANVGDYRERREATLKRMASRTADKVYQTGQPVFLEPMPAFERKQIHAFLSEDGRVETHSEGDEPHRYLVVEPLKK